MTCVRECYLLAQRRWPEVMPALESLVDNLELEVSELEAAQSMFAAFPSQLG